MKLTKEKIAAALRGYEDLRSAAKESTNEVEKIFGDLKLAYERETFAALEAHGYAKALLNLGIGATK